VEIKEIAAKMIGCEPDQLMAFKNYAEDGIAAIGPEGKKYIYTVAELEEYEAKLKAAEAERKAAEAKPKRSTPAKRTRKPAKRSRSTKK
jgi:hypothetical protein